MDGRTRKFVAWSCLPNCGAEEALEVLTNAVTREFPENLRADGVALRADPGSQFIANRLREGAKVLGIQVEAIRKNRPEENGMSESYHGHLKMDYSESERRRASQRLGSGLSRRSTTMARNDRTPRSTI